MPPEPVRLRPAERMAGWLYSLVMWLLIPFLRRKLQRRARAEPAYLLHTEQRLGRYGGDAASSEWLWVHAVSLGETRAAALLLQQLRAQAPQLKVLLTHGTATGMAEGAKLLEPGDRQVWLPWDTRGACERFVEHFRPALGVLMETEVWPNLIQACHARGVPLYLLNARLNETSYRRAQQMAWLSRPAFARLRGVLAQTPADAERLRALGARVLGVFGNLKFDVAADPALTALGQGWKRAVAGRRVVMLASSREGEEALWLQSLLGGAGGAGGAGCPDALWLVVPRHPQRFHEVEVLIRQAGLSVFRRSRWTHPGAPPPEAAAAQVWLGDTLGEMPAYYAMADLAWLGGSYLPYGGQNLLEAAAQGCPVVLGPHTYNFADVAHQAIQVGAAFRVPDMREAAAITRALLDDSAALSQAREACHLLLRQGCGAAQRYAGFVLAEWHHLGAEA